MLSGLGFMPWGGGFLCRGSEGSPCGLGDIGGLCGFWSFVGVLLWGLLGRGWVGTRGLWDLLAGCHSLDSSFCLGSVLLEVGLGWILDFPWSPALSA